MSTLLQSNRLLSALNTSSAAIDMASSRIASGNRLVKASDDPVAFVQASRTEVSISRTGAELGALARGLDSLEEQSSALNSMQSIMGRIQELAIRVGTPAIDTKDAASEMEVLQESLMRLANKKTDAGYLFGGTTNSEPFSKDGAGVVTYSGTTDSRKMNFSGMELKTTLDGTNLADTLNAVSSMVQTLKANNKPTPAQVGLVQAASDQVMVMQGENGAQLSKFDALDGELQIQLGLAQDRLDRLKNADLTQEVVNLAKYQAQQDATLKVIAQQINRRTLFDII